MYAVFTMRKLMLTNRINQLNFKLMEIAQKNQDLAVYSANIADGVITPEEAANSPASLFQRQSIYSNYTTQNAYYSAGEATNLTMSQYNAQAQANANAANTQAGVDPNALFSSYYKQALEAAAKNEDRKIAVLENELDQQRLKIETQLKAAQAELEQVESNEDKAIKSSAPKYVGGPSQ